MKLREWNARLHGLVVFRSLLDDPVVAKFADLTDRMEAGAPGCGPVCDAVAQFEAALFEHITNWGSYLSAAVLEAETVCVRQAAAGTLAPVLQTALDSELAFLQALCGLTLDELLEQLRGQGYVSVDEVRWAVLENSGQLSILPWARQRPPTAEELGLTPEEDELPFILINDGRIVRRNLARSGRNEAWLQKELRRTGHSAGEIFLLTVDGSGKVLCIPKEAKP